VLEVMQRLRDRTTIFLLQHILEDVQRVSDTVAIMNHGNLVAAAHRGAPGPRGGGRFSLTVRETARRWKTA